MFPSRRSRFRSRTTDPYELQPAGSRNERKRSEACCRTTTDPRRVSKQVSREPPQAWLFGLVRFGAPGRTKSAAGRTKAPQASQFSAPQAGKNTRSAAICSSRSVFARAAPAEQQLRGPLVVHKQRRGPPRGRKLRRSSVLFFLFFPRGLKKKQHRA